MTSPLSLSFIRPGLTAVMLCLAVPSVAQDGDAGAYLAARQASQGHQFATAIPYLERALVDQPDHALSLEQLISAHLALGQFDKAQTVAERIIATGQSSQAANLARMAAHTRAQEWSALLTDLENGLVVGPLMDGVARGWAAFGQGDVDRAIKAFDDMAGSDVMRGIGLYHKALALALAGNAEGANEVLTDPGTQRIQTTREMIVTRAQMLSQMDQQAEALALLRDAFGATPDAEIGAMIDTLDKGDPLPFTVISSPAEGIAEAALALAGGMRADRQGLPALLYARTAQWMDPSSDLATLVVAQSMTMLGRSDLAADAFGEIPRGSVLLLDAELGRADALEAAGDRTGAIAALSSLAERHPDNYAVFAALGDILATDERHDSAERAYTRALELLVPEDPTRWVVHYTRGITRDALGDWTGAEADFRAALEIQPDQANVLNYLGYSLVERQENLDEALKMIEQAVAARPDSGAIVDSFGWVLFRMGRYDDAIGQMERAVELEPTDPILTDHLADVLWAVNRKDEARYQWKRALSFSPEDILRTRILQKLDLGLDAVLEQEGAAPLHGQ